MGVMEVLAGGAATGKTTHLLELYRTALRQAAERGEPGTTLWLSPSFQSVREVQSRLVDATLPAVFQPNVLRFDEFALRILKRRPVPVAPLTPTMRRALLRRIVDRQVSERKVHHFASIAQTSGFLDLLTGFISELKRAEIWPESYLEICSRDGTPSLRDRELTSLYVQYQSVLLEKNLYDTEGRFWFARRQIEAGAWAPFETLSLVVVDGFTDFLHTQHEILEDLANRADRLILSLPLVPDDSRSDLFAKPQAMLDKLRSRSEVRMISAPCRTASDRLPVALRHIADHLFCSPREELPTVPHEGVEIVPAAGATSERQVLAARVKALLLKRVSPNDIVIVLRRLTDADLLAEQLVKSGIPTACEAGVPLSRTPAVRALMTALLVETEDWPFERLTALLDSNYFQPKWPDVPLRGAARAVAALLRKRKLSFSREAILEVLEADAARVESTAEHGTRTGGQAASGTRSSDSKEESTQPDAPPPHPPYRAPSPPEGGEGSDDAASSKRSVLALALLKRLDAAFAPLREKHTLPEWSQAILAFTGELGMRPPESPDPYAPPHPDQAAWDVLQAVLADLSKAERCLQETDGKLSLAEFVAELTELARKEQLSTGSTAEGCVRILDAEHVRNVDVPYLFVAGLTEDSFPARTQEDCVLHEVDRRRLRERGLDLRDRDHQQQDEMLLFYNVVTRARKQLVLSYAAVNAEGHPLSPSPYLVSLQGLFPTLKPEFDDDLDPIPPVERVLTEGDLRVYAMSRALQREPALLRSLSGDARFASAVRNTLAAVDMADARFHKPGLSIYEGRLETPANLKAVAEHYAPGHEYSVSRLEDYVGCPFRFMVTKTFGIEELESPDVRMDYATRGIVAHHVLAEVHKKFLDSEEPPTGEQIAEQFVEQLKAAIHRLPHRSAVQRALAGVEERFLTEIGRQYGAKWDRYLDLYRSWSKRPRPALFEQAFGTPTTRREASIVRDPLVIGDTRIGGFIDRIDIGELDGRPVFIVIDYKTGRTQSLKKETLLKHVTKGQTLQLPLYAFAVEQLGLAGADVHPFTMGYWGLSTRGFEPANVGRNNQQGQLDEETWAQLRDAAFQIVPRLAEGLRHGQFPVFNDDEECTRFCALKTICRVGQIRALSPQLSKEWEPPVENDKAQMTNDK